MDANVDETLRMQETRIFYHILQLWPWKEINFKLLNLESNIKACILWALLSSSFFFFKRKNQSPFFLMFFVNNSTELSTHIHHHKSKHPIKGDGSFFHLALGSWIWVHSRHHSTINDPILVLNASNNNRKQNVYYN